MRNAQLNVSRKYRLIGTEQGVKDFIYIFEQVLLLSVSDRITEKLPVVICAQEKHPFEEKLKKEGSVRGKDYFYAEDFYTLWDNYNVPAQKKIAVWGTGNMAEYFMEKATWLRPSFFIDTYKNRNSFCGIPIYAPKEISDWEKSFVIVAVNDNNAIMSKLAKLGLKERIDYVDYREYMRQPSFMLYQTMCDKHYYDLDCRTPLNHLEILRNGETSCCCTTFMDERIGNIYEQSSTQIWKSIRHRIIALSVQNRTYTFCKKGMCPLFVGEKNSETNSIIHEYQQMEEAAKNLVLAFDQTCNLFCDTCRNEKFIPDEEYKLRMKKTVDKIKEEYLSTARFLVLAGDGEVFASPSYREVFLSSACKDIKYIRLLSNGMLFNRRNWEALTKGKNAKVMLTVSIDAATKDTYERIRRGGNFDVLRENMKYAAKLRKLGELSYFRINFVVQKKNYMEMPDFVLWGEELGCDEVFFTKILNWGTYSDEEFADVSMMEKDGVTPKAELLAIMNNPVMQSSIVDMGTIQSLHKEDKTDIVYNYYMWELEKRGGKLFDL